jgi:hypothetical protein
MSKLTWLVETSIKKLQKQIERNRKMGYIEWKSIETRETRNDSNDEGIFLKFAPGKFKVRCIGKPYFFEQTFLPKKVTGTERDIPLISPGKDNDPLIKLGFNPAEKIAVNVLDRKDGNKLKVMRIGPSIYSHIVNYHEETGVNPCDPKNGPEMLITVEDPGGNPRQRKYSVTFLQACPIKKEEAAKIKSEYNGLYDLEKLFQPASVEEIEKMIEKYGLGTVDGNAEFDGNKASDGDGDDDVAPDFEESGDNDDDDDDISF